MPFESGASSRIEAWDGYYGEGVYPRGHCTGSAELALIAAEEITKSPDFNPGALATRYSEWYEGPNAKPVGKTTDKALEYLSNGCPWVHSGISAGRGCDGVIRAIALGAYYKDLPDRAILRIAETEAALSHDADTAKSGSAAVALTIAHLSRGETNLRLVGERVVRILSLTDSYKNLVFRLISSIASAESDLNSGESRDLQQQNPEDAHVLVSQAYYCVRSSNSFEEAMQLSVRGSADLSALTGGIAGAMYGVKAVAKYLPSLYQGERIRDLERVLLTKGPKIEGPVEWK